jgi:hypothetical protein
MSSLMSLDTLHSVKRLASDDVTPSYEEGLRRIVTFLLAFASPSTMMVSSGKPGELLRVNVFERVLRKQARV